VGACCRVKLNLTTRILDAGVNRAGICEHEEVEVDVVLCLFKGHSYQVVNLGDEVEAHFGATFVPPRTGVVVQQSLSTGGVALKHVVAGDVHFDHALGERHALKVFVAHVAGFAGSAIFAAEITTLLAFATGYAAQLFVANLAVAGTAALTATAVRAAEFLRAVGHAGGLAEQFQGELACIAAVAVNHDEVVSVCHDFKLKGVSAILGTSVGNTGILDQEDIQIFVVAVRQVDRNRIVDCGDEVETRFGATLVPTGAGILIHEVVHAHRGTRNDVVAQYVFENFAGRNFFTGELIGAVESSSAVTAGSAATIIATDLTFARGSAAFSLVADFSFRTAAVFGTTVARLEFFSLTLTVAAVLQGRTAAAIVYAFSGADVVPGDITAERVRRTDALFARAAAATGLVQSFATQGFRRSGTRRNQQCRGNYHGQNSDSLHFFPPYRNHKNYVLSVQHVALGH